MKTERIGRGVWVEALKDHYRVRVRRPDFAEGRQRYPYKDTSKREVVAWAEALLAKLDARPDERTLGDVLSAFERGTSRDRFGETPKTCGLQKSRTTCVPFWRMRGSRNSPLSGSFNSARKHWPRAAPATSFATAS